MHCSPAVILLFFIQPFKWTVSQHIYSRLVEYDYTEATERMIARTEFGF